MDIEMMYNILDEEVEIHIFDYETIVIFENGKRKRFLNYSQAVSFLEKHGFQF